MEEKELEEMRNMVNQEKQPQCPYCNKPLEVIETQGVELRWVWNKETKRFDKTDDGDADGWSGKPECINCGVKDWDFTNNGICEY